MRLQGKVALITGAASGIGLATAMLFTAEGASVLATDWNEMRLKEEVARIKAGGGDITGSHGDIGIQTTAEGLVERTVNTYGRIDILVNNAGIMDYMQGVAELADDIWRRVLRVNLDGPMFTCRQAIPHMIRQGGGAIINIASTAAISGGAAGVAYTVSKHGLIGLTTNTAWMYAQKGIRCNAICPGGTKTNIAETMPRERVDPAGAQRASSFAALMPAMLEPAEIAALALFLASDDALHINGAIIPADAGWMAL